MIDRAVLHPTDTVQGRLLSRRRAERLVIERLLASSGGAPEAGAIVHAVLTCSRELSAAGVDHGFVDVLHSMACTRLRHLDHVDSADPVR